MPGTRYVAAGCSNTHSETVSMHKFPKDPEVRWQWEKQVSRTRERWSAMETSFLSSDHFEADCFEVDSIIASQMGMKKRKRLKPGAIPTIFVRHLPAAQTVDGQGPSNSGTSVFTARKRTPADTECPPRRRSAFEK